MGLILYYLVTRSLFLQVRPVYYDSFEYVRLIESMSKLGIVEAIRNSHQPVHTLYLWIAGGVNQLIGLSPQLSLSTLSLVAGLGVVIFWVLLVKELTNSWKVGYCAGLVLCMVPGFFVTNTNILYESLLLMAQVMSLWSLIKYLKTCKLAWLILGAVLLGISQLVFIGSLFLLIPIATIFWIMKDKMSWGRLVLFGVVFVMIAGTVDVYVLGAGGIIEKYLSHTGDLVSGSGGGLILLGRVVRNIGYIIWQLLGPVMTLLVIIILIFDRAKLARLRLMLIGLALPAFLMMQYWHAGYYGRLGMLVILPASLMVGIALSKRLFWIIYLGMAMTFQLIMLGIKQQSTPYVLSLKQWVEERVVIESDWKFVTSDNTRMAFENSGIEPFVIRDPEREIQDLSEYIKSSPEQRVYIDRSALSYPYWQPDGWEDHLLSKKKGVMMIREWVERHCNLREISGIIYEISDCVGDGETDDE